MWSNNIFPYSLSHYFNRLSKSWDHKRLWLFYTFQKYVPVIWSKLIKDIGYWCYVTVHLTANAVEYADWTPTGVRISPPLLTRLAVDSEWQTAMLKKQDPGDWSIHLTGNQSKHMACTLPLGTYRLEGGSERPDPINRLVMSNPNT